jgi:predicted Zn-dependent peptidase
VALLAVTSLPAQERYEFEEYTLPNGLRVILSENHSAAVVAINLWYDVGSRNERPGRSGFAHLF